MSGSVLSGVAGCHQQSSHKCQRHHQRFHFTCFNGQNGVVITTDAGTVPSGIDLKISGVINDGGSGYGFTKAGPGVLALTAANTYTGNTVISAGALQLGDGVSASGSVAGNIDDQATLVFANPTAQAYAGVVSDYGSVVKTGAGTLTLTGANTYSGSTTVSNGTMILAAAGSLGSSASASVAGGTLLVTTPQTTFSGSVTVNDGATLSATASADAVYLAPSSLTLGSTTGATLNFGAVGTVNPLLNVAGALTLNGTTTINITSCPSLPVNLPLIGFGSIGGSGHFVRGSLPPGVVATLVTNGNTIYLNMTTGTASFEWTGLNNTNWDKTTTNNWLDNGVSGLYGDGAPVQFDDTSARTNVNVAVTVAPSAVIVTNNTDHYTFSSAAGTKITGGTSLTKNGNGTLTLTNLNSDFTGGVVVNAGVVEVSGAANLGSASGSVLLNGGTLSVLQSYTNSQALAVNTAIGSGSGLVERGFRPDLRCSPSDRQFRRRHRHAGQARRRHTATGCRQHQFCWRHGGQWWNADAECEPWCCRNAHHQSGRPCGMHGRGCVGNQSIWRNNICLARQHRGRNIG